MHRALLSVALLVATSACAASERRAPPARDASTASAPAAAPSPAWPDVGPDEAAREGDGRFNEYRFKYKRTGNAAEAFFEPRRLPWNDNVVVAAARELIVAAFDDRSDNFPRPVEFSVGVKAIKLEGERYEYVFFPVGESAADGSKEARVLKMWRLHKGSTK